MTTILNNGPRRKTELEQLIWDVHSHDINYHTREIYVHSHFDYLDEEPGVDFRMATAFLKNMHILDSRGSDSILVHMHTVGGEWNDGMAMFWAIRHAQSPVTLLAHSHASSMSGIILQAADKRVLVPDCDFMIHHGSIAVADDSIAVKSAVETNNRLCKRMLQIFARRAIMAPYFKNLGYDEKKIEVWLDRKIKEKRDWYLTAEEAIEYGFADGILGSRGYENIQKIRTRKKSKIRF
jgi:ATP-dependent protease ClpP protease subunit